MRDITEPPRRTPVIADAEVVVLGSGPGGLAAAVAAARAGASVVLIERFGCFGGNITAVGVEGFAWYRRPETVDSEGIGREFEARAIAAGGTCEEPQSTSRALDAEMFKVVADELVAEAGIEALLHCQVVAPIMEGRRITGVITESKSGRGAVLGRCVIDATGDADIARRAGAPCAELPLERRIGCSVMFSMAGVDKARFLAAVRADPQTYADWAGGEWDIRTTGKEDALFTPFLRKPFQKAAEAGLFPSDIKTISGTWSSVHDTGEMTYLNLVHLHGYDGADMRDLTRAEIAGRREAIHAIRALRAFMPGCETAKLRNFGMTLGVRDSRKIRAVYDMTEADVRGEARFDDAIGIFPEFIDGYGVLVLPTTGRYFHVPFRATLPTEVEGLLVAGRAIGGEPVAHASTRNMMCCTVTGQGAGVAAALAARGNALPDRVDLRTLQRGLADQGVRLH